MKAKQKLLGGLLAAALLLGGCQLTQEKAAQRYKDALDKNQSLDSCQQELEMDIHMDLSDMELNMEMEMDLAFRDKGQTAQAKTTVKVLGVEQELESYIKDGVFYTAVPDQPGMYLRQDSYSSLLALSGSGSSQLYKDAIDKAQDLSFEEDGDSKELELRFSFGQESLETMGAQLSSILEESMLQGLEDQLKEQYGALGLDQETLSSLVEQTVAVYQEIFGGIQVQSITQEATINKEGYLVEQELDIALAMDWTPLFDMMGQELDDTTRQQLSQSTMIMEISHKLEKLNGDVQVQLPDINDSNTISATTAQ